MRNPDQLHDPPPRCAPLGSNIDEATDSSPAASLDEAIRALIQIGGVERPRYRKHPSAKRLWKLPLRRSVCSLDCRAEGPWV